MKATPEDFLVEECGVPQIPAEEGSFSLLRVTKRGLTTFEAVALIADQLEIDSDAVGYAGLKDEDGITSQLMSVPHITTPTLALDLRPSEDSSLVARVVGAAEAPLDIGAHQGNVFGVVVRGLPRALAHQLERKREQTVHFLNYYDLQRFGLPDKPKVTHLVGKALIDGDYSSATKWLRHGQSTAVGLSEDDDPIGYFSSLEPRLVAFYMSAYESYLWNMTLSAEVSRTVGPDAEVLIRDNLTVLLPQKEVGRLAVLQACASIPRGKYRVRDGNQVREVSLRPTVVQAHVGSRSLDDGVGSASFFVSFYLPPGCYATMLMLQLFRPGALVVPN